MKENTVDAIIEEVNAAIAKIAKKHKLNFKRGNVSWSSTGMKFKNLEFLDARDDGLNAEAANQFIFYGPQFGIKPSALNVFFTINSKQLKIVGWKNSNRKDKILLSDADGNSFKCSIDVIRRNLSKSFLE